MIYIITEKKDLTTDLVIEWLINFKRPFKRINDDDFFEINGFKLILNKAKKVWHRRGTFSLAPAELYQNYPYRNNYLNYLKKEISTVTYFFEKKLKMHLDDNYLGSFIAEMFSNKLCNLDLAKKIGLKTPETILANCKEDLNNFLEQYGKCIHKDLFRPVQITKGTKRLVSTGVKILHKKDLGKLKETFAPILVDTPGKVTHLRRMKLTMANELPRFDLSLG